MLATTTLVRHGHRWRHWAPRLVWTLTWAAGVLALVEGVQSHQRMISDSTHLMPLPAGDAATAVGVGLGLVLLRTAAGLRRQRRRAWQIAFLAAALICGSYIVKAHRGANDWLPVLTVSALLLAVLVSARSQFTADSAPTSRWDAPRLLIQFVAAGLAYGLAFLWVNADHIRGDGAFGARVEQVLLAMVGVGGPIQLYPERVRDLFGGSMLVIGLVTAAVVTLVALRPARPLPRLDADDEASARQLLTRTGERDSLGYFALRRDKSLVWSPSRKSAVAYRVVAGVLLASGDPLGDPEAWPGAVKAWTTLAAQYGWVPAVMGCSELGATVYQRVAGLRALAVGDEAIVETNAFSLEGRRMRPVRQPHGRVERAGYTASIRRVREVEQNELAEVRAAAAVWRGDVVERGFSMALSRLGDPADGDCVLVTGRRPDGRLAALLHLCPWGSDGLSLDLMRRDRNAENGLTEYLIAELLMVAPELGIRRVSLNFAMFRDVLERGQRLGATPTARACRRVLLLASRWWQIESLYKFNAKFEPRWQPRLLCYTAARDMPRIVAGVLRAEAFLTVPAWLPARAFPALRR